MRLQHVAPAAGAEACAKRINESFTTFDRYRVSSDPGGGCDAPRARLRARAMQTI